MGIPAIFGGNRYLVPFSRGIATTSVRTGLAMTAFFQTPIYHTARLSNQAALLCQPTEKGRKNTAAKQPPSMAALRGDPFSRKVTSKRRTNTGATPPSVFRALFS